MFNVNGFIHTGSVVVELTPADTYTVSLYDKTGRVVNTYEDAYCDNIGKIIDGLVERDPEWSDKEYYDRVAAAYGI